MHIFALCDCMMKSRRKQYGRRVEKAALGWVWGSEGGIPAQQKMGSLAKQSVLLWKERGGEPSELGRGRAGLRAVWGEQHKQWDGGTGWCWGLGEQRHPIEGTGCRFFSSCSCCGSILCRWLPSVLTTVVTSSFRSSESISSFSRVDMKAHPKACSPVGQLPVCYQAAMCGQN